MTTWVEYDKRGHVNCGNCLYLNPYLNIYSNLQNILMKLLFFQRIPGFQLLNHFFLFISTDVFVICKI